MQGVAIGGEGPGAWVFVAEHARRGRTGLAIGLLTSGLTVGILLGSLMATGLNLKFNQDQILHTIWRVPFVVGGVFGFIALMIRRWLAETPVFEEMRLRATLSKDLPLRRVLRDHRGVGASMAITWVLTAAIVVIILMTPMLLQRLSRCRSMILSWPVLQAPPPFLSRLLQSVPRQIKSASGELRCRYYFY
jgi:MFS family permease